MSSAEIELNGVQGDRCWGIHDEVTGKVLTARRAPQLLFATAVGGTGEYFADATDEASEAIEWTMPAGRFVDALPLLVLTTASLRTAAALHPDGDWDLRRF